MYNCIFEQRHVYVISPVNMIGPLAGIFSARRSLYVPPVERISTPTLCSDLANDTTPVLSDTLIRARLTTAVLAVGIVGKVCQSINRIGVLCVQSC